MTKEFRGVLFDVEEQVIIERSPILRTTYDDAMKDAEILVNVVNDLAEEFDDNCENNSTVGRVDDSYCFVQVDGVITFEGAEAS